MAKKTRQQRYLEAALKEKPANLDDANLISGYLHRLASATTNKRDTKIIEDLAGAIMRAGWAK